MAYWRGSLDTAINLGDAVVWFTRSAAQKYAASHWALGQMALENGDQDVAIEWWRRSIDLGYAPAMRALARLLLQNTQAMNGLNDDGDHRHEFLDRAMELLTTAVQNGDAASLAHLGVLHQVNAIHPTSSDSSSNTSLHHSTVNGSTNDLTLDHHHPDAAQDNDSYMADDGDDDEEDQTELQRQKQLQEQGLATRCFEQAAEMGHVESMFLAAESWHSQQQYAAALEYYERAAKHGHLLARVMRARYRLAGLGGMESNPTLGYEVDFLKKECVGV
jgi:TPR repeat protein